MKNLSVFRLAALSAFVVLAPLAARAQNASPQQIQGMISSGQESAALDQLGVALQAHPDSAVAWYLSAEAQDARGNEAAARSDLAKAEQYEPGLPFAKPGDVSALQAHLNGYSGQAAPSSERGFGISPMVVVIGILAVLFIVIRLFLRSRRRAMMPYGMQGGMAPMGGQPNQYPPYGPGGPGYSPGMGGGSGIGGALMGGLAAGAGLAAGERLFDGLTGGGGGRDVNEQPQQNDPGQVPSWDDGLNGSPGWDNSNNNDDSQDSGGGFDPGNNW